MAENMQLEVISLEDLTPDPGNINQHPQRSIDALAASLKRFGWQKPIVIDADNIIRAGNGTYEAAKQLGLESAPCIRSELSKSELVAFSIADNRLPELSQFDMEALHEQLQALSEEEFDLSDLGFSDADMNAFFADAEDANDWREEWQGMPEFEQEEASGVVQSIKVNLLSEEAREKLAKALGQTVTEKTKYVNFPYRKPENLKAHAYVVDEEESAT